MSDIKTVSLVLGSGGARSLAHIGVIHWLEENNYKIESISGCSTGALIGGVYAVGRLDEFEQWMRAITKLDIVSLLDISWCESGLIKGDKIINTLIELVGDQLIENLPIRYTAIAADVVNEKEVWINSGNLFDAIRASMSLPLFFTPYDYNGISLVDGGVLNPVPITPTYGDDTLMTVAVNLGGSVETVGESNGGKKDAVSELSVFHEKISHYIKQFQNDKGANSQLDWNVYDVANQALEAMQSAIARQQLTAYPPDFTIEIARNACGALEFDRADEMIALGYGKARKSLESLTR